MAGLDATGFTPKTFEEIAADLRTAVRDALGQELNLGPTTLLGGQIDVIANELASAWEAVESVYAAQYPSTADGSSLDRLSELTGTIRLAATESEVTATLNIDEAVTVLTGSVASVLGLPLDRFVTLADAVGPGPGAQDVQVEMEAESTGPVAAPAGTLAVIETPVAGWNSITNAADADLGTDTETDAALRLRRLEIAIGKATIDSIRRSVSNLEGVTSVRVFENTTEVIDGDGLPPHSFEVVVLGGDNQEIADTIFDGKPAGIETSGTETETSIDSQGDPHTIKFSRPTLKPVFVDIEVTTDPSLYPIDGDAQIKTAVAEFIDSMDIGEDVVYVTLFDPVLDISGVVDVTVLETGFAPAPSGVINLPISNRELATGDSADVTVVST